MHELAVTAVGADRPGIVAAVTRVLRERGGNLESSAMTILGGHFAIVLLVSTADAPETLHDALAAATDEFDLTISVSRATGDARAAEPTHQLSVYGADRPGIVAGVSAAVADEDANVTNLETQVVGTSADPVYAMLIELVVPDEDRLTARLDAVCVELGVDHTLRALETETY